jgi:hypothetical protein
MQPSRYLLSVNATARRRHPAAAPPSSVNSIATTPHLHLHFLAASHPPPCAQELHHTATDRHTDFSTGTLPNASGLYPLRLIVPLVSHSMGGLA